MRQLLETSGVVARRYAVLRFERPNGVQRRARFRRKAPGRGLKHENLLLNGP
jgi:hypothetical protein